MICSLTGMDVANASMYDGPTAAAEAMRMCVACTRKRNTVVASSALLPSVLATLRTYASYSGINLVETWDVAEAVAEGTLDLAGVIVPSINRFGIVESHLGLSSLVHEMGGLLVFDTNGNIMLDGVKYGLEDFAPIARFAAEFGFEEWQAVDAEHSAVRFCTSWATPDRAIDDLEAYIEKNL